MKIVLKESDELEFEDRLKVKIVSEYGIKWNIFCGKFSCNKDIFMENM